MAYEQRPNSGTLGKNKRKTEDKHPDYAGDIDIDGKGYFLNGWLKENKATGEKFFSLSVKAKTPKADRPPERKVESAGAEMDENNPPF